MDFKFPNLPSKCSYHEKNAINPHEEIGRRDVQKIYPDILQVIGNTPLVRLNRIPQSMGIKCEMLVKCEYKNPGGSVKDRMAVAMVEDAEKRGLLTPESTVIEPTTGNTGIALAMACAVKGYKCVCVAPEKTSIEKRDILKSLGAQLVVTPDLPIDDPNGVFIVSQKLEQSIPGAIMLHQFHNSQNPLAHYYGTALEILEQCDGQVDMVAMGAGTGGTMTGVGRRLKELKPSCLIVGVDPMGSTIAEPQSLNDPSYVEVEGIGHNFYPPTLDKSVVDFWLKVEDKSAFLMGRRLHKEEGILCGSSAGCIMSGALEAAKRLKEGQRCVVVLPDGVANYLTKFVSDYWMESKKYIPCVNEFQHWWWNKEVSELPLKYCTGIPPSITCKEVTAILNKESLAYIFCVDSDQILQGIIYAKDLIGKLLTNTLTSNDPISKIVSQQFRKVTVNTTLGELSHILEREEIAVVVEENENSQQVKLTGVLIAADLLNYITNENNNS